MKILRFFAALLLLSICIPAFAGEIIPQPKRYEKKSGSFTILTSTKIAHSPALRPLADYLAEYLPLATLEQSNGGEGNILLSVNENLGKEAYTLEVTAKGILIEGGSEAGVFYGIETLLQMLPAKVYTRQAELPFVVCACKVEDEPHFSYRGFMLDVSRTWIDAEGVKEFIENLAHHKINKLHIHLTDDEGWRIEIKSHPELTEVGGYRGVGSPVAGRYGRWQEHYGGYYTQEQMREIIEFAALRNVEIIPEIDLPGHSHNLARVRPDVLCNFTPDMEASLGYDTRSALCVSKEENYKFLEEVFSELAELFPSKYIHIGGDEVVTSQWKSCPDCQALSKAHNMQSGAELQEYFMNRLSKYIVSLGKKPCVWNEAINAGTLTKEAVVYGWESVDACRKATREGYATIVMPGHYFYFDMRQSAREPGHNWAAIFDASKVLSFDLEEQGFTSDEMKNVAGIQASFFSELYISHLEDSSDYLQYQTYPRICSLSEVAWCGKGGEWDEFNGRLINAHYDRMLAMGIDFRLALPTVKYADGVLTATTADRTDIYYSIVGEEGEHKYTAPIKTDKPARYLFHSRRGGACSGNIAVEGYYTTLKPAVKITSSIEESKRNPYSNAEGYSKQARTARTCKDGDWILYTFEEPVVCRRLEIPTGYAHLPRLLFNAGYIEVSYDGENFERVGDLKLGAGVIDAPKKAIKAVRIVCTESGNGAEDVIVRAPNIYPVL
ncbi:MAG: family 20 glycosylhydrolase [Alistipes sp.]|nr:family 20 glycosylhydrolase [Alistipes sp.]